MDGYWATASSSGPCAFWDDISQMKMFMKTYQKQISKRDFTIEEKVSYNNLAKCILIIGIRGIVVLNFVSKILWPQLKLLVQQLQFIKTDY